MSTDLYLCDRRIGVEDRREADLYLALMRLSYGVYILYIADRLIFPVRSLFGIVIQSGVASG